MPTGSLLDGDEAIGFRAAASISEELSLSAMWKGHILFTSFGALSFTGLGVNLGNMQNHNSKGV